jgi:hypothetical protein
MLRYALVEGLQFLPEALPPLDGEADEDDAAGAEVARDAQ